MPDTLDPGWIAKLSRLDYAYQPIVNIHTGNTFACEALLRCHKQAGFSSIDDVFDRAYDAGVLHQVDLFLRHRAIIKFAAFRKHRPIKLFYNLDNRLFDSVDYSPGNTAQMLSDHGYALDDICFEISEKHRFHNNDDVSRILGAYRKQGYKIAVDDCGTGFSGLQLLYYAEPDYIKIDRFFIQNLENDPRKRLVVSTIVNFAHITGSLVLAEGVETRDEYCLCKEIGCDMVQGYFVGRPRRDLEQLKPRYEDIALLTRNERRNGAVKDRSLITGGIEYLEPVRSDCDIITVIDKFKASESVSFFPVVNRHDEPVGIIRESAFKEYIFSKFGRQILENPSFGRDISRFITRIPMADIHSSVEKLIETYTHYNNNEGLIMLDDMKYVGLLGTKAMLKIINEKNIALARNQNPLTRLPGNMMIHEYIRKSLTDGSSCYHLIYFDFDNFKPYNDKFGFRNGDRLILMFADLLKQAGFSDDRFIGHIGGDDFFMGIKNGNHDAVIREMENLALRFKKNAESFYDPAIRKQGFMMAANRDGMIRRIPLITASTAILQVPDNLNRIYSIEETANIITGLKKDAKQSENGMACMAMDAVADYGSFHEHREYMYPRRMA